MRIRLCSFLLNCNLVRSLTAICCALEEPAEKTMNRFSQRRHKHISYILHDHTSPKMARHRPERQQARSSSRQHQETRSSEPVTARSSTLPAVIMQPPAASTEHRHKKVHTGKRNQRHLAPHSTQQTARIYVSAARSEQRATSRKQSAANTQQQAGSSKAARHAEQSAASIQQQTCSIQQQQQQQQA